MFETSAPGDVQIDPDPEFVHSVLRQPLLGEQRYNYRRTRNCVVLLIGPHLRLLRHTDKPSGQLHLAAPPEEIRFKEKQTRGKDQLYSPLPLFLSALVRRRRQHWQQRHPGCRRMAF